MAPPALRFGPKLLVLIIALLAIGSFFELRPFLHSYLEKRETCADLGDGKLQLISITDSGSGPPELDPGFYHFDLSGYCYHAACDLDLRSTSVGLSPTWPQQKIKCRGNNVDFTVTISKVNGFFVPRALRKLKMRVVRDGVTLYDDMLNSQPCTPRFCMVVTDL